MRRSAWALSLLVILFCSAAPALAGKPLLIKPEALKGARGYLLLDGRATEKYEAGHLPGAISLPWVDLAQMPKRSNLKDAGEAADILTSRGVRSDRWLIVYGDGADGWGEEGRLVWSLQYLGHPNVSLLDGGLPAWKKLNLPVTTEGPDLPTGTFRAAPLPALRMVKADLHAALGKGQMTVLDVREPDEFAGAVKYGEARGGHIPGAINLPWKELLAPSGALLPPAELKARLVQRGVDPARPVVVYCTGGVRSGLVYVALRAAGLTKVSNFDGSYWEWAGDAALPVAKGQ